MDKSKRNCKESPSCLLARGSPGFVMAASGTRRSLAHLRVLRRLACTWWRPRRPATGYGRCDLLRHSPAPRRPRGGERRGANGEGGSLSWRSVALYEIVSLKLRDIPFPFPPWLVNVLARVPRCPYGARREQCRRASSARGEAARATWKAETGHKARSVRATMCEPACARCRVSACAVEHPEGLVALARSCECHQGRPAVHMIRTSFKRSGCSSKLGRAALKISAPLLRRFRVLFRINFWSLCQRLRFARRSDMDLGCAS